MKYNNIYHTPIRCIFLLALCFSTPVYAEKSISLQDELTPQGKQEKVESHAYKDNNGATVIEHRLHGKVWMIEVQPAGNFPAYYLYDSEGNGNFERRIAGNKQPSPPMWIIKKF